MNRNKLRIPVLLVVLALALAGLSALGGCSAADEPVEPEPAAPAPSEPVTPSDNGDEVSEGEAVLIGSCTDCHDANRIYLQPEGTDWQELVQRMEEVHGAQVAEAEREALISFLSSRQQSEAERTITGECSACHDLTRLYQQPSATGWEGIMTKMVEVHGLVLSEAEQDAVIEYLENR